MHWDACWVCQVSLWGRWLAELKQQTGWFESCAKVRLATMVNYTRESKRRYYSLENSPWKKTEITKELRCNSGNTPWKRKKHLGSYQFLGSWFCGVVLISETWLYFFHMSAITWLIGRTDPQILEVSWLVWFANRLRFAVPCLFVLKPGVFYS